MKKILAIFLILCMSLTLFSCGTTEVAVEDPVVPEPVPEVVEDAGLATAAWSNKSGDFVLTVVGAEKFIDSDGDDALRIYYDFTNKTTYTTSLVDEILDEIYSQGGVELEYTFTNYGEGVPEEYNRMLNIRPGVSIRCINELKLQSEEAVSMVCEAPNLDEPILEYEFDLAALPGVPAEGLPMATVAEPEWIASWPSSGTYDEEYHVAITSSEFTEDLDGEKLLRVYIDFTNNSSEADSFGYAIYELRAFQDGVQLEMGQVSSDKKVPESANYYTDVEPGQTISVAAEFELISESPIEIEVHDPWTDGGLGLIVPGK
ncbi:MAG: DUF5067 domain-containing protein [Bacillota bacterium]|nr:DUF5067 domain-containing protein [Bacillota bacterium]